MYLAVAPIVSPTLDLLFVIISIPIIVQQWSLQIFISLFEKQCQRKTVCPSKLPLSHLFRTNDPDHRAGGIVARPHCDTDRTTPSKRSNPLHRTSRANELDNPLFNRLNFAFHLSFILRQPVSALAFRPFVQ